MSSTDRPIPGTGTSTTAPPTPAGGPPLASPPPQPLDDGTGSSTTDQLRGTADHGTQATKEVAGHARSEVEDATQHAVDETKQVVETAKGEVRDVVDEARDAVREQADRQSHVAAEALGRLRDDLRAMKGGDRPREGTAEYLDRAASALDDVVQRLDREGVEGALSGLRSFARRSPGGFLAATAGAGFAIGRILRNGDHPQRIEEQQSSSDGATGSQAPGQREIDLTREAARFDAGQSRAGSPFVGGEVRR